MRAAVGAGEVPDRGPRQRPGRVLVVCGRAAARGPRRLAVDCVQQVEALGHGKFTDLNRPQHGDGRFAVRFQHQHIVGQVAALLDARRRAFA